VSNHLRLINNREKEAPAPVAARFSLSAMYARRGSRNPGGLGQQQQRVGGVAGVAGGSGNYGNNMHHHGSSNNSDGNEYDEEDHMEEKDINSADLMNRKSVAIFERLNLEQVRLQ
jgi:hypothetical protein